MLRFLKIWATLLGVVTGGVLVVGGFVLLVIFLGSISYWLAGAALVLAWTAGVALALSGDDEGSY